MEGVSSFVRPTLPSKILEPKTEESPEKTRSVPLLLQEVSDGKHELLTDSSRSYA